MTATHTFFRRPRLRDGVEVVRNERGFTLAYRKQSADLELPPDTLDEVGWLLDLLIAGAATNELAAAAPGLANLDGLLDELDRLGLLTEGDPAESPTGIDGTELYRRVRRFAAQMQARACHSRLYESMANGVATRNQLIGYAMEYHHVVRRSPALIAPALAHAWQPAAFELLQRFVAEEIGHDRMTARALAAAGVPPDVLDSIQPLPATFAVCATLGTTAAQDPLSFVACLFLMEAPSPDFNRAFASRAGAVGLAPEFAQPLLDHSNVNEDAGHADISLGLLATVGWLGTEHIQAVLKQVAAMIESLARMEDEILAHYAADKLLLRSYGGTR
jgi:Iron-containing redox enzyme